MKKSDFRARCQPEARKRHCIFFTSSNIPLARWQIPSRSQLRTLCEVDAAFKRSQQILMKRHSGSFDCVLNLPFLNSSVWHSTVVPILLDSPMILAIILRHEPIHCFLLASCFGRRQMWSITNVGFQLAIFPICKIHICLHRVLVGSSWVPHGVPMGSP